MRFLLDTDICIYLINASHPSLSRKVAATRPGDLCTSAIVEAELRFGAQGSTRRSEVQEALTRFFAEVSVLPFDRAAASRYGEVRAQLARRGRPIGPLDTLIAGHTLSVGLTLVTNNEQEFRRVKGLRIENWASSKESD